jgi:tRNA(Ile)-lysidine synthase
MLLNLMRGTGIRGLHGIKAKNGYIIRPLLACSKQEIIDYLQRVGESFVTDSTNLENDYTRNKIRLEIIPLMREINPSICATLAETAERIEEAEKVYDKGIEEGNKRVLDGGNINIDALLKEPSPLAVIHETLHPLGFNSAQCEEILRNILAGDSGKRYKSSTHIVSRDRNKLIILPAGADSVVAIDEELPLGSRLATVYGEITAEKLSFDGEISKCASVATLDSEKIKFPLKLRSVKAGDRFRPYGMRGSKLVSDYLTDRKKSLIEKQAQLVVCDNKGEIVWVVNERPSAHCCINEKSKNVFRLEWTE